MKLTVEKHQELLRLAYYFKKIEDLAEKMGVDIDDLLRYPDTGSSPMYTSFRNTILSTARKRAGILKESNPANRTSNRQSDNELTILVNDRFHS